MTETFTGLQGEWQSQSHLVGDVRIHTVTAGEGPLVILVHGFPESWRTWRHQLRALAAAGYRAVALDVRGYGRSSRPEDIAAYGMLAILGDLVGLVGRLGADTAAVVGHDWGGAIAWNCALLRPDVFTRVASLSVPYTPRGDKVPTQALARMAGPDHEFYMNYFQQPGRVEAEIEPDMSGWLRAVYGGAFGPDPDATRRFAFTPVGTRMIDAFDRDAELPEWLEPEHFTFLIGEFERTGLTGGLNRYRNLDRDWYDLAAWRYAPVRVPALFIGGDEDGTTAMGQRAIERFDRNVPALWRTAILPECGHWIGEEQPGATNELLLAFLADRPG